LSRKYNKIIENTQKKSWIDCLLALYIINLSEIWECLLSKYPAKQIASVSYENIIKNEMQQVSSLYKHLGINNISPVKKIIKQLRQNTGSGNFNIYKTKRTDDWQKFLSLSELQYISYRVEDRLKQIHTYHPHGKILVKVITPLGLDLKQIELAIVKQKNKTEKIKKQKEIKLIFYQKSRECVINEISREMVNIKSADYLVGSNNTKNTPPMIFKIAHFQVSKVYITNANFCSLLNYLNDNDVVNSLHGNYLFYNPNMPAERGGKIFLNNKEKYCVISGFENHPANWVSWLGAATFAKWGGMRLIEEIEWEYLAWQSLEINKEQINQSNSNISYTIGDTSEVYHYDKNTLGIYDMFGNVRTWCRNWYHHNSYFNDNPTFVKSVRGGSWNRNITSIYSRDYKPWLISARGIGFRVVKDKNCVLLNDKKFLADITCVIKLANQQHNSFKKLLEINQLIDKIFQH